MPFRSLAVLLPVLLLLVGCRQDPPGTTAVQQAPDSAAVSGPLYDSDYLDAGWETRARSVILQDNLVREAQAVLNLDTVRVTAVIVEPDETTLESRDISMKARQFVVAAMREVEGTDPLRGGRNDPLAPTRYAYLVSIRSVDGERLYDAVKPPAETELREIERDPDTGFPEVPVMGRQ